MGSFGYRVDFDPTHRISCFLELEQTAEVAPLQLLVFINPFGGPGKAEQLFEEQVLPMFTMAEVQSTIVVTSKHKWWCVVLYMRVCCVHESVLVRVHCVCLLCVEG